jgi:hypothetical protein
MEQTVETTTKESSLVTKVSKKMWEAVAAIPVEKAWVDAMHKIADQMTAVRLAPLKDLLHGRAETVGKAARIGALTLDVAASVASGMGAIRFGRDMQKGKESIKRAGSLQDVFAAELHTDAFKAEYAHDKKGMLLFSGIAGAAVIVRPGSRAAFLGAKTAGFVGERIMGVINTIALRSEKIPPPTV